MFLYATVLRANSFPGALALDSSVFGSDGIPSTIGFSCLGNETELVDCSIYSPECPFLQQASLLCQGLYFSLTLGSQVHAFFHDLDPESTQFDSCVYGDLRLANSSSGEGVAIGRLELCLNQAWGTVCREHFGYEEARVACRQIDGFTEEGMLGLHADFTLQNSF